MKTPVAIEKKRKLKTRARDHLERVVRRRWFAQLCLEAEDGWAGPFKTIDEALDATLRDEEWWDDHSHPVYITTGRKLRKAEIEEMGVDYAWEVDIDRAWAIKRAKPSNKGTQPVSGGR